MLKCKICGRTFPTIQALAGHIVHHYHPELREKHLKALHKRLSVERMGEENPNYKGPKNATLTERQKQIILGGLLGDLCLHKEKRKEARLRVSQKDMELTNWLYQELKEFVITPPKKTRNRGFGKILYTFTTCSHRIFTEIYKLCYPNGIKTITQPWLNQITHPIALATWYMMDGSLCSQRNCHISTYNFTFQEQKLLADWLEKKWKIPKKEIAIEEDKRGKGYYMRLRAPARDRLFDIIRSYILPTFSYKILPPIEPVPCAICGKLVKPSRRQLTRWKKYGIKVLCSEECRKIYKKVYAKQYYQRKKNMSMTSR